MMGSLIDVKIEYLIIPKISIWISESVAR